MFNARHIHTDVSPKVAFELLEAIQDRAKTLEIPLPGYEYVLMVTSDNLAPLMSYAQAITYTMDRGPYPVIDITSMRVYNMRVLVVDHVLDTGFEIISMMRRCFEQPNKDG